MAIPPFEEDQGLFSSSTHSPPSSGREVSSPSPSTLKLTLPSTYQDDERNLQIIDQSQAAPFRDYLQHDLDVLRLTRVHKHLWLAGLPQITRNLHSHIMIGRQVLITERADLHLVWQDSTIYIKPLPDYLMDYSIWRDFLCRDNALFQDATGFLYSYISLICHKSDLKLAHDQGLLSKEVNWEKWIAFSKALLSHLDYENLYNISPRYLYGELRLARLNMIYRFCRNTTNLRIFFRGYQYRYHQYSTFLERNFAWVLTAIVYITIVLTAMQVGLATKELKNDTRFNRASYGFTVFSILAPLIVVVIVAIIVFVLAVFNLRYALRKMRCAHEKYQSIFRNQLLRESYH